MVHVPWLGDTPRSPATAGIDTLAIEVSSTFMNVASATASDATARALPSSGGGPLGLAPGAWAAMGLSRGQHSRASAVCSNAVLRNNSRDHLVRLRLDRVEGPRFVGRLLARDALQALARALVRVDVDAHREADLQGMRLELLGIEDDTHRHALHHLDPVAGG